MDGAACPLQMSVWYHQLFASLQKWPVLVRIVERRPQSGRASHGSQESPAPSKCQFGNTNSSISSKSGRFIVRIIERFAQAGRASRRSQAPPANKSLRFEWGFRVLNFGFRVPDFGFCFSGYGKRSFGLWFPSRRRERGRGGESERGEKERGAQPVWLRRTPARRRHRVCVSVCVCERERESE